MLAMCLAIAPTWMPSSVLGCEMRKVTIWRCSGDRPAYCAELAPAVLEEAEYADVEFAAPLTRLVVAPSLGRSGCSGISNSVRRVGSTYRAALENDRHHCSFCDVKAELVAYTFRRDLDDVCCSNVSLLPEYLESTQHANVTAITVLA